MSVGGCVCVIMIVTKYNCTRFLYHSYAACKMYNYIDGRSYYSGHYWIFRCDIMLCLHHEYWLLSKEGRNEIRKERLSVGYSLDY